MAGNDRAIVSAMRRTVLAVLLIVAMIGCGSTAETRSEPVATALPTVPPTTAAGSDLDQWMAEYADDAAGTSSIIAQLTFQAAGEASAGENAALLDSCENMVVVFGAFAESAEVTDPRAPEAYQLAINNFLEGAAACVDGDYELSGRKFDAGAGFLDDTNALVQTYLN